MAQESILTTVADNGVATIKLNRPRVHNAFDDEIIGVLTEQFQRLEADTDVRVVVLGATGDSFSAGADINWMRRMADYSKKQNLADAKQLAELMRVLNELRKPTIARVHGAAFGGGVGLVACCDIAVATDKASFSLSEVKLGLIPSVISPYVVRAIGQRQARRYFLTAERFDAREALRIGLVHKVCGTDDIDNWIEKLCSALHHNGPLAVAAAKSLVREVAHGPISPELIELSAERIADIRVSDEGQEGLDAFLSKRKPDWAEDD